MFKKRYFDHFAFRILRSPQIRIDLFGGEVARQFYEDFTAPHPLLPLVGRKYFGVALVDLADEKATSFDTLRYARRRYNRTVKSGHVFREFDATRQIDDVIRVNISSDVRQGKKMAESYANEEQVKAIARRENPSFGVFSADGELIAYTHTPIIGDAFVYSRILAHKAYLESGTMFRLVLDTNKWMRRHYLAYRYPRWGVYDMFLGASEGLRYFKEKAGFLPYRVDWQWTGKH